MKPTNLVCTQDARQRTYNCHVKYKRQEANVMPFSEEANGAEIIKIHMFGRFSLSLGNLTLSDSFNRTHQLWNLLEYLIAFRGKSISSEELIEAMWPNGTSDNPSNALKNLIYRVRTIFQQRGFPIAREMIRFTNGSYCWNNDLPCQVDIEEFERLIKAGNAESMPQRKIAVFSQALQLYQGDLLPGSSYEEWVISLTAYYRSMYFKCVYETCDLLLSTDRFDEVGTLCERAIAIDSFEERAHRYMIYSLIRQGYQSAALEHYNRVTDLFYRELGIKPTNGMRELYREIVKTVNSAEADLGAIKEDLSEHSLSTGAFYCEYEVFKNMYRVEARGASRNGHSVFLGLFTVTDGESGAPDTKTLSKIMDALLEAIKGSLRRGDVVSRFSSTQFVVMLPTVTFENGQMITERIGRRFTRECKIKGSRLHTNLQPMTPIES